MMKTLVCMECGMKFQAFRAQKFCSRECGYGFRRKMFAQRREARLIVVACKWCGEPITTLNPIQKFCSKKCQGKSERNPKNWRPKKARLPRQGPPSWDHAWDTAQRVSYDGYVTLTVKMPGGMRVQRREHIVRWERAYQMEVPEGWVVHHVNGIRTDNRLENLVAMPGGDHVSYHAQVGELKKKFTGRSFTRKCKELFKKTVRNIAYHEPLFAQLQNGTSRG